MFITYAFMRRPTAYNVGHNDNDMIMIKKCYNAQSYKLQNADCALQLSIVNNSDKKLCQKSTLE